MYARLHEHDLIGVVDFVETQSKRERGENADDYHAHFMCL